MRFWSVFRKAVREQKRDLWVLGLSLAFAPFKTAYITNLPVVVDNIRHVSSIMFFSIPN